MVLFKKVKDTETLGFYRPDLESEMELQYIDDGIAAGFPSPANDYIDLSLDLNKALVRNPSSTFYAKVKGHSMKDEGINDGDMLIIDKSLEPSNGDTAVCFIDGEFTVKKIRVDNNRVWLIPANPEFKPIEVSSDNDFLVWGIVVYVIKKV